MHGSNMPFRTKYQKHFRPVGDKARPARTLARARPKFFEILGISLG
jgi:hypothetical protein